MKIRDSSDHVGRAFSKLNFELEEGMKVNLVGRVQLYEPGGSYSIIIEK